MKQKTTGLAAGASRVCGAGLGCRKSHEELNPRPQTVCFFSSLSGFVSASAECAESLSSLFVSTLLKRTFGAAESVDVTFFLHGFSEPIKAMNAVVLCLLKPFFQRL